MPIMLSYSLINDIINCPHVWLNRVLGLKKMTNKYMLEGSACHKILQAHVSNKDTDKLFEEWQIKYNHSDETIRRAKEGLKKITIRFPIVEEIDRDPRTHFEFKINDEYIIHGYKDADDPNNNRLGEFKFSSNPWGMSKFYNLMQWRIYALSGKYTEAVFITGTRALQELAIFTTPITDKHREEARVWIQKGIDIIESGDFMPKPTDNNRFCGYIGCRYC